MDVDKHLLIVHNDNRLFLGINDGVPVPVEPMYDISTNNPNGIINITSSCACEHKDEQLYVIHAILANNNRSIRVRCNRPRAAAGIVEIVENAATKTLKKGGQNTSRVTHKAQQTPQGSGDAPNPEYLIVPELESREASMGRITSLHVTSQFLTFLVEGNGDGETQDYKVYASKNGKYCAVTYRKVPPDTRDTSDTSNTDHEQSYVDIWQAGTDSWNNYNYRHKLINQSTIN